MMYIWIIIPLTASGTPSKLTPTQQYSSGVLQILPDVLPSGAVRVRDTRGNESESENETAGQSRAVSHLAISKNGDSLEPKGILLLKIFRA